MSLLTDPEGYEPVEYSTHLTGAQAYHFLKLFAQDQYVTMRSLRKSVLTWLHMYPDIRPGINFLDFCTVMDLDVLHTCAEMTFKSFSFTDLDRPVHNGAPERKINIRPILMGLCAIIKGSLEDKIRLMFSLYDPVNDGFIPQEDMVEIIMSCHYVDDERQVMETVDITFMGARQAPSRGISAFELFEVLRNDRRLIFPYEPAGQKLVSSHH